MINKHTSEKRQSHLALTLQALDQNFKNLQIKKIPNPVIDKSGFPFRQFNRWSKYHLTASLLNQSNRKSIEENLRDRFVNINMPYIPDDIDDRERDALERTDLYTASSLLDINNDIKDILKDIVENACRKLDTDNEKDAYRHLDLLSSSININLASSSNFLYNLSILDRFYDFIGKHRTKSWIEYGSFNDIITYCTGELEKFFTDKEVEDFYNSRTYGIIPTPDKIKDIHSHMVWLEKISTLERSIDFLNTNKDGTPRKNPLIEPVRVITGKGYLIKCVKVDHTHSHVNLFSKKLSAGRHAFVCIDQRQCDTKKLQEEIDNLIFRGYGYRYICVDAYAKKYDNEVPLHSIFPMEIPDILVGVEAVSEGAMQIFDRIKEGIQSTLINQTQQPKNSANTWSIHE